MGTISNALLELHTQSFAGMTHYCDYERIEVWSRIVRENVS